MDSVNPYQQLQTIRALSAEALAAEIRKIKTPVAIHHIGTDTRNRWYAFITGGVIINTVKKELPTVKEVEPTKTDVIPAAKPGRPKTNKD